jgi:hypothetical protein
LGDAVRRHRYVIGGLTLALALCLTACGVGERQNPTASDEETGSTHVAQAEDQKPATYTTKSGDTLLGVAARPEVYDDPGLWPLIKDANRESLEDKSADTKLAADLVLDIPRNASPEAVDAARSRARAWAARMKSGEPAQASASSRHARGSTADADDSGLEPDAPVGTAHEAPSVERKSQVSGQSAANQAAEAAAPAPAPAGGGHGSRILPLFFLLLLVLAALGAVLYVFSRRDRQDLD